MTYMNTHYTKTKLLSALSTVFFLLSLPTLTLLAQRSTLVQIIPPSPTSVGHQEFLSKDGRHYIGLSSPDTLGSSHIFRLPSTDPGGCINTDGSYNMSIGGCGGPNSLLVGPTSPLYVMSHFQDDDAQNIRVSFSKDNFNWTPVSKSGICPVTVSDARDPSIKYANGKWWILASPPGIPGTLAGVSYSTYSIQLYTTVDFITCSGPTFLDMRTIRSGTNASYAPEWFDDPNSSHSGFLAANSIDGGATFLPYFVDLDLNTLAMTGNAMTLGSTSQGKTYDYFMLYDGDVLAGDGTTIIRTGSHKYYWIYVDQYTPTTCDVGAGGRCFYEGLSYATSTSLLGTFTTSPNTPVKTSSNVIAGPAGTSAYSLWDYFGGSATSEAPAPVIMPNGCVDMDMDTWLDRFPAIGNELNNPRQYLPQHRLYCPASGADLFTNPQDTQVNPIKIARAEHFTITKITDPGIANIVYRGQAYWQNAIGDQGHIVLGDTRQPGFYPLTLNTKSAHGFIQNDEAAEIGWGGVDAGEPSGYSYASLIACGTDTFACAPPFGGKRRIAINYQGTGGGTLQINNTNIGTGESSICLSNGVFQFGAIMHTASTLGNKANWCTIANPQYLGPTIGGGNIANNAFAIYNQGLGALIGTNPSVGNPGFETGSLSPWVTSGTTAIITSPTHSGTYAASLGAPNSYISMVVPGLTTGNTYLFTAWIYVSSGNLGGAFLRTADGSGGNITVGNTTNSVGQWSQIGLQYTATSTGQIGIRVVSDTSTSGTIYVDDIQVYNIGSPVGAYPLSISSFDGTVLAPYGFAVGLGDASSLSGKKSINMDSQVSNVLNIGDALKVGNHNAIVRAGVYDASAAYRINGVDVVTGGENRVLKVQRIEPGYTNIPVSGGTSTTYTMPTGAGSVPLFSSTGPGNITRINVSMLGAMNNATMLDTRLHVVVDGSVAMDVDLGTFYLMHGSAGGGQYSDLYAQKFATDKRAFVHFADSDSFGAWRYIFIPYTTSCAVTLVGTSASTPANLYTQVDYYEGIPSTAVYGVNKKVFHSYTTEITTTVAQFASIDLLPTVTLAAGVTAELGEIDQVMYQNTAGLSPGWLEGDPKITIDGYQYMYGGTEDFFGGLFYWDQYPVRTNYNGVGHIGPGYGVTLTSAWRGFKDPVTAQSSLTYTWFNGQPYEGAAPGTTNVGAFVYYYTSQ